MNRVRLKRALLLTAVVVFGVSGSIDWSQSGGLSLSVESAQARVGRPLTPVSVAGVARRTTRRAVVGGVRPRARQRGVRLSLKADETRLLPFPYRVPEQRKVPTPVK
jgi:hypothetical protein